MCSLGLPDELVEDGELAVSEISTNAFLHAAPNGSDAVAGGELWIWCRTLPRPQLVISVYDTDRAAMPRLGTADLLDQSGKGLAIVEALATAWGAHLTRSRLGPTPQPGKRVWFSVALPGPSPWTLRIVSASLASKRLLDLLRLRGVNAGRTCDDKGIALIQVDNLNTWVEPKSFTWHDHNGDRIRLPHLDLQEAVEHIIATVEAATTHSPGPHGAKPHTPPAPPLRRPLP